MIAKEKSELIDDLAEYAHEAWSGWMRYLFSKCHQPTINRNEHVGGLLIPPELVARWTRQLCTDYKDLPLNEKDSDVSEGWKMARIFDKHFPDMIKDLDKRKADEQP